MLHHIKRYRSLCRLKLWVVLRPLALLLAFWLLLESRLTAPVTRLLGPAQATVNHATKLQTPSPGQVKNEAGTRLLEPGQHIERELALGADHSYRITLIASQYLHVVVDQQNIDVSVTLFGPDGKQLAESDDFKRGAESISLVALTPGNYRLVVRSAEPITLSGRYVVKIRELRAATSQDRDRLATEQAAQQLMNEGKRLQAPGSVETLKQTLEKYREALRLWQAADNQRGAALALTRLGLTYDNSSEKQEALAHYQQALQLWRAIDDRPMLGLTLASIGMIHLIAFQHKEGRDRLQEALPFVRESNDRGLEAATLTSIGGSYVFSEPEKALEYLDQALTIWHELKDRFGEAHALRLVGAANHQLGKKDRAAEYFKQAGQIMQAGATPPGEATSQEKKRFAADRAWAEAEILVAQGAGDAPHRALEKYQEALDLWQAVPNQAMEANTLIRISSVYLSLGEKQKPFDYLNQALLIWRAIGNCHGEALALSSLAEAHYSLGEKQAARDYIDQALPVWREVGDRNGEAESLYLSARVEHDLGALQKARTNIEAALIIIESLRARIANPEWRASYYGSKQAYYEFYIDLLMQLSRHSSSTEHQASALRASERARARSLLDLLTEAHADIRGGIDPALLERERTLQKQINDKERYRMQLLNSNSNPRLVAEIDKEMEELLMRYQGIQSQIRQRSPRYAALTQPQPLSLTEIQLQVLDNDTLLLEYALGEKRSYLWAVTTNSIASFELPKRGEIEAAARRVYELLTERNRCVSNETDHRKDVRVTEADAQYAKAAEQLSRMLFGSVAEQLGNKRLLIVADGALQYVPFAALPAPEMEKRVDKGTGRNVSARRVAFIPLIVDHEIINLPSASTMAILRRELAGRKPAPKALAVLADPVFNKDDERVSSQVAQASRRSTSNKRRGLSCSANTKPGEWSRLVYSEGEANRIVSFLPAEQTLKALGFQANRATATSDELSQYRIVHFSTHGKADSERPELSMLVLSLVNERGEQQDGYLSAHEVYNLKLPVELVVLSACETGLGKNIRGEGLISLTRGFMYAGAKQVVVSLWSVNDAPTADLMAKFYRAMLKEGLRPTAALRQVQIEMWKSKRLSAPFFWAGFTPQGEWR